MPIQTFPLGPWGTNAHLLYRDGHAVIMDVGDDPAEILNFLRSKKLSLTHICITHLHSDHVYGVAALQKATGAVTLTPTGDDYLRGTSDAEGGDGWPMVTPFTSQPFTLGEQELGGFRLRIFETPGHTRGSVSLYYADEKAVFAGDVLFHRGIGRSDFLGGDEKALFRSIREKLFTLPDDTIVYAGHGPNTKIGDEKRANPYCGGAR